MSTSPNLQSDIPSQSQPDAPANLKLPSSRFIFWLVLCAMVLLASNMRAPIVALGSIAPVVQGALDISETQIGWLGAVPMLTFALGAFISPTIGKRFGLENTLITMIALLTAGMVIRSVIPTWIGF
jgi:CP family cyanate transporter-like MFS transporter